MFIKNKIKYSPHRLVFIDLGSWLNYINKKQSYSKKKKKKKECVTETICGPQSLNTFYLDFTKKSFLTLVLDLKLNTNRYPLAIAC